MTQTTTNSVPQAVLRLPNPRGHVLNFASSYKVIYDALAQRDDFSIDDGVVALIERRMVSSSGAVGTEALRRSTRKDRTRDPLFNQFKMFSELYRLLGWLHATTKKSRFRCTALGRYVAAYERDQSIKRGLVEESLVGIVMPNVHSRNIGVRNLRPFAKLLELMLLLDGEISRDEMILGIYTIADDQPATVVGERAKLIHRLRQGGDHSAVAGLLAQAARGRQVNSLWNYTRFMIGAITGVGWAAEETRRQPYSRRVKFFKLTAHGREVAEHVVRRTDLRQTDVAARPVEVRAALCEIGHIGLLARAGVAVTSEHDELARDAFAALPGDLRGKLPADYREVEFSPYQQADGDALRLAES
jgi:hypothetical protein